MKILWIVNILLPEAKSLLSGSEELKSSGGWMLGAADALLNNYDVKLAIATVAPGVSCLTKREGKHITYYYIPIGKGNTKYNKEYEPYCKQLRDDFMPDVVHVHGSEYSHGLSYIKACGSDNVVLSIQGMVSVYALYQNYGLSTMTILKNLTFRDIIKRDSLLDEKRQLHKQGKYEIEYLRLLKHVIGRTSWDYANCMSINSKLTYHFCNETLRNSFYDGQWSYNNCIKHSIFCSSAQTSIKGFHQLIKVMPQIIERYPDVIVKVAGLDIVNTNGFLQKIKQRGYGKILKKMINDNNLGEHIEFLGSLNEEEMKNVLLECNVFICPSSIENSPNSLGEAQILGVPVISSYVGGVMDMIPNKSCGLMYRYEELPMLAAHIINVFESSGDFNNETMIAEAKNRHNRKKNAEQLFNIYNEIIRQCI